MKVVNDEIINNCIDIAESLDTRTVIPILDVMLKEDSDLVSEVERKRRKKASESQKKRLEKREEQVQKHIKGVLKKCRSKKLSKTEACDEYFKENITALRECGINSKGTLRNRCSHTKPNMQRSAFFNRNYVRPNYSKDFQKEVIKISERIKETGF